MLVVSEPLGFVMFLVDAIGDYIVEACSSIGLVTVFLLRKMFHCICPALSKRTLSIGILLDNLRPNN